MADKAAAGQLPRIGDLIEGATGIKFDTYKDAQSKLGLEAAMAAIASNPDYKSPEGKNIAQVTDELLLKQAQLRIDAVNKDIPRVLAGEKLDGLGSSYLMVKTAETAPAGLEATLERAKTEMKDPAWLRAEGASNVTNFTRDMLSTVNGAPTTAEQKIIIGEAAKSGTAIADALIAGKPLDDTTRQTLTTKLEAGMDAALAANPAIKETEAYKANYDHFRVAMREGIAKGLDAVKLQHAASIAQEPARQMVDSNAVAGGNTSALVARNSDGKAQSR